MSVRRSLALGAVLLVMVLSEVGCGRYPAHLTSRLDIATTASSHYAISIGSLPLELYPELAKFRATEHVFFNANSDGATNAKLEALAKLPWEKLRHIVFGGSKAVSDAGLVALARISTLQGLQLDQTGVTDVGLARFVSSFPIKGLSVAGCRNVTRRGIEAIGASPSLKDIGFSTENLSAADVAHLLQTLRVDYCAITDTRGDLDHSELMALAGKSGIKLSFHAPNP